MKLTVPRILIAGTNSGCGKTTLVCTLLTALKNRGVKLCSFKCGPDYIDPMFHATALGVPCRNLDLQFFGEDMLRFLMSEGSRGYDLALIEGVMGYYDGVGATPKASSYEVAKAAGAPAVLVVNARGAAHSVLAAIHGFVSLYPDSGIAGVILNNCSAMFYPQLRQAILDCFGGRVAPLGYMPPMPDCAVESRHLGLVTAEEIGDLDSRLQKLAAQAEKSIDLDSLLRLAGTAPEVDFTGPCFPAPGEPVRIAVARDKAFCFYYEDNLTLLEKLGAEIVPFSPLRDTALPENIQGLYLGGGYPELYTQELAANEVLRASIREALQAGLPCIAECGGFLYLQDTLLERPMVGLLPGGGRNTGKLQRFGYVTLTARKDNLLCDAGDTLPAHEFHYFDVDDPGADFRAEKPNGRGWDCGFAAPTLYAGFPHFHFCARPRMADRFLAACRKEKHRHD